MPLTIANQIREAAAIYDARGHNCIPIRVNFSRSTLDKARKLDERFSKMEDAPVYHFGLHRIVLPSGEAR